MRPGSYYCLIVLMMAFFGAKAAYAFDPDAPGQGLLPPTGVPVVVPPPGLPGGVMPGGVVASAVTQLPPELVPKLRPVSLFLNAEEQYKINEAIAKNIILREKQKAKAESNAKDFLNQLDKVVEEIKAPEKPTSFTYPQFFLQYLSYQNENEWLVIIDGQKFSPAYSALGSWLQVVAVNKEMVVMEWTPQNMEMVLNTWMTLASSGSSDDVKVDSLLGRVIFTLQPNQTFSSYAMRVVEGKIMPVTITIVPDADTSIVGKVSQTASQAMGAVKAAVPALDVNAPKVATPSPSPTEEVPKTGSKALDATYKKMGLEP